MRPLAGGVEGSGPDALTYLDEGSLEWWQDETEGSEREFSADSSGLATFITRKLRPWLIDLDHETEERPDVRLQAHGESLDPVRMDKLLMLDERLGRQFEKALGMLIKLQGIRGAKTPYWCWTPIRGNMPCCCRMEPFWSR